MAPTALLALGDLLPLAHLIVSIHSAAIRACQEQAWQKAKPWGLPVENRLTYLDREECHCSAEPVRNVANHWPWMIPHPSYELPLQIIKLFQMTLAAAGAGTKLRSNTNQKRKHQDKQICSPKETALRPYT